MTEITVVKEKNDADHCGQRQQCKNFAVVEIEFVFLPQLLFQKGFLKVSYNVQ